jgi:hypothetical protein
MSDPLSSQQKADAFYGYAYKSLQIAEQACKSGGGVCGIAAMGPYNAGFKQILSTCNT